MPIDEIQEWLQGDGEYAQGLRILKECFPQHPLLSLLQSGENSFTHNKLCAALEELLSAQSQKPKPRENKELLLQLETQRKDIFFNTAAMHGALMHVETNAKRADLARQILENREEVRELWKLNDYVKEHGHLPGEDKSQDDSKMPLAEFLRLHNNARTSWTKWKKKLSQAKGDDEKHNARKHVELKKQRLDELEAIKEKAYVVWEG